MSIQTHPFSTCTFDPSAALTSEFLWCGINNIYLILSYQKAVQSVVTIRCVSVCVESVPDPLDMKSSDISTDSFRVSWQHAAPDVVLYRLTWTPTDGGDSKEVCVCVFRCFRTQSRV